MIHLQPSKNLWQDTKNNLWTGIWLFVGSQRAFDFIHPSFKQLILWTCFACIVNIIFSWLLYGDIGHFNIQGVISYILWPGLALLSGIVISQHLQQPKFMFVPAIFWLVLDVYIISSQILIQLLVTHHYFPYIIEPYLNTVFAVIFVWQTVSILWILSKQLKWRWKTRLIVLFGTIFTLIVWQFSTKSQPIWKVQENIPTLDEQVFYTQPKLLQSALNQLKMGNIEESEWYFLGVAGMSHQDVFKSEIKRIKQQFDTDFNTKEHSMALINNPNTLLETPIATKTSIALALKEIGQKMNREQDVLFLYLTSHGLENEFHLENPPLNLEPIDPIWLRKTLDSSGIRWRVIVVSACRSGSFIPALQSPDTLIITASASDKDSFGCSHEAEYTYFGRAFFDQALRQKATIKEAFMMAQHTVAQWEQQQGFIPSEPQWSLGKNMQSMLPQFEQVLFPQNRTMNNSEEMLIEP